MWLKEAPGGKVRYCERYTDELTGKKKDVSVTFEKDNARNRKEALRILTEKIQEKQSPTSKSITLRGIYEEYIEDLKHSNKKESTCRRNEISLGIVVDLIGKDVLADKLTAHIVRKNLAGSGKPGTTLNEYLKRFKTMMRWAYRNDLIEDISFIDKLENFYMEETEDKITEKYLEQEELKELESKLEHELWKDVILFLALSGMRIGEVIALHKKDIDLDARLIHISKNYDPNNDAVTTAKTPFSNNDISIQDELVPVIKRINKLMSRQQIRCGYRSKLFLSDEKGRHISYFTINKYFTENTERILGRRLTLHSLRHTHASLLFEAGFSVPEVQRRLRHRNSRVTEKIYIHITKKLKEKDAEKLKKVSLL